MIKAAVIGAGWAGNIHGKILATELENTKLSAVVEKNEKKGIEFSKKYHTNYYNDSDEMLKKEDVDLVVICTPTHLHAESIIKAANANKVIFCEKPLALTLKEADKAIEAIKRNNVKCMIGHVLRFWPEYVKVKQIVDSGKLGKPLHGVSERLLATPNWTEGDWYIKEKYGGGAALDAQIHDIDFLIWIFGNAIRVDSQGVYDRAYGGWAHIATNIEFESGGSGFVQAGIRYQKTFPFTMVIRIICEKGTIEWIFRAGVHLEERGKQIPIIIYKQDGKDTVEVRQDDPYLAEWKYFIDCLVKNKKIENASIDDGRRALEVALASVKSAEKKTVIKLGSSPI
jgi:predicted dehydrogenase